jgi:O-antigen ligase
MRAITTHWNGVRGTDVRGVLTRVAAAAGAVLTGLALAVAPFLTAGVATGAALLIFALLQPLVLLGLMLALGPVDLSFVTGGFKGMFAQLGGLDMNGIRLMGMSAAMLLVVLAERRVTRQLIRPAAIFYVALVAFAAFSLAYSPAPIDGARLLLKIAWPLLIFLVITGLSPTRAQLDRLMDFVLIGAVVICLLINPLYVAFGDFERNIGGWMRLSGAGIHQNPFAFYLIAALLMAFVRYATRREARYLVLCAICAAWMVLTVTRIAFLAVIVALLVVGAAAALATRRTRILIAAVAVAVVLSIPFGPPVLARTLGYVPSPGELLHLMVDPRALVVAINWEGRMVFWPVVYQAYLASPVIGLGMGASAFVLRATFPSYWSDVVHNDYLRLLSDTGAVGVALFGLAMIAWLVASARALRVPDRTVREYALPALGCIAGLGIIGITDSAFDYYGPYTQYTGFLTAGAIAAAVCWRRSEGAAGPAAVMTEVR